MLPSTFWSSLEQIGYRYVLIARPACTHRSNFTADRFCWLSNGCSNCLMLHFCTRFLSDMRSKQLKHTWVLYFTIEAFITLMLHQMSLLFGKIRRLNIYLTLIIILFTHFNLQLSNPSSNASIKIIIYSNLLLII